MCPAGSGLCLIGGKAGRAGRAARPRVAPFVAGVDVAAARCCWCGLCPGSGGWQSLEYVEDEIGFLVGGLLGEVGMASEPFVDLIGGVRGAGVGSEVDKHQGSAGFKAPGGFPPRW